MAIEFDFSQEVNEVDGVKEVKEKVVGVINEPLNNSDKEAKRMMFELMEADACVDVSEEIELPPVAISCGEYSETDFNGVNSSYKIPIGTYGNFSFIQAPPKSMKTYFVSLLASAYQGGINSNSGLIEGHREGKKIIHFDTEQGKFHCQNVFRRPLFINNIKSDDDYHTYALRAMTPIERLEFIEYILYDKLEGSDIGLVIIDGVADLVDDVNDLKQSSFAVQKLMKWTAELQCHIITVIHSNKDGNSPTGHLGSFLEKKTETQIKLEKNSINAGWISVECKRSRNRGFDTFSFCLDKRGMPEFVDNSYDF
jgi:hypothetical protein